MPRWPNQFSSLPWWVFSIPQVVPSLAVLGKPYLEPINLSFCVYFQLQKEISCSSISLFRQVALHRFHRGHSYKVRFTLWGNQVFWVFLFGQVLVYNFWCSLLIQKYWHYLKYSVSNAYQSVHVIYNFKPTKICHKIQLGVPGFSAIILISTTTTKGIMPIYKVIIVS